MNFSKQGGHNYTQNNLIDGFFIIPPTILLARPPTPPPPPPSDPTPRIFNPIPKKYLETFHTQFFEAKLTSINELTQLLENNDHFAS